LARFLFAPSRTLTTIEGIKVSNEFKTAQERYRSELLGIDDATAKYFGPTVSPFSTRRWIATGVGKPPVKLKAIRIGGRYFLRPCDIDEFIKAMSNPDLYRRATKAERVERAKRRLVKAGA
jgi:hypothetical protein